MTGDRRGEQNTAPAREVTEAGIWAAASEQVTEGLNTEAKLPGLLDISGIDGKKEISMAADTLNSKTAVTSWKQKVQGEQETQASVILGTCI